MSDTEMPEDFWADKNGNRYDGNFDSQGEFNGASQYRLKSTVDAERAEDSRVIAELAGALEQIKAGKLEPKGTASQNWHTCRLIAVKSLSDNAARIAQANTPEKVNNK